MDLVAELSQAALPLFIEALVALVGVLLYRYTGIKLDKKAKEDLHDAMQSGAESALRFGPGAGLDAVKSHVRAYAEQSASGAIRRLVPGDTVLDNLAVKYANRVFRQAGWEVKQ